jgi:hypothetical protein
MYLKAAGRRAQHCEKTLRKRGSTTRQQARRKILCDTANEPFLPTVTQTGAFVEEDCDFGASPLLQNSSFLQTWSRSTARLSCRRCAFSESAFSSELMQREFVL